MSKIKKKTKAFEQSLMRQESEIQKVNSIYRILFVQKKCSAIVIRLKLCKKKKKKKKNIVKW